jgi:hypothetical protein
MTSPPNPPRRQSSKWLVGIAATGIGLVVLLGAYMAIQYIGVGPVSADDDPRAPVDLTATTESDEQVPNAATDFVSTTCDDFDLTGFEALAGDEAELDVAQADPRPDTGTGELSCTFTTAAGQALGIALSADTGEGHAEAQAEMSRSIWETQDDAVIEDYDDGDFTGFTLRLQDDGESLSLIGGRARLYAHISVTGEFADEEALALAEAVATQVLTRFAAYI